jgi:BirA family biotin operon repressor/biotin-[acetyl-CoA-carboxylase] ligase
MMVAKERALSTHPRRPKFATLPHLTMAQYPLDTDRLLRETFVARAEHHSTLSSTNDRARQCAAVGTGELPLLVVADRQTAGRGRGGHRWWTGQGSLAFSLLLDPGQVAVKQRGRSPLVALAAAVAVVETVEPLIASHQPGIRWPNDVVAAGRKLAGVLVEVLPDQRWIVGIGVNTNNSPAEAPPELRPVAATLLELTGVTHDQTTILVTLLQNLEEKLAQLASEPERIGARADELCLQRGKLLTLHPGDRSVTGRCAGIAPDGALLLETPSGRQAFYSGMLK